jgi:hypothetical protein
MGLHQGYALCSRRRRLRRRRSRRPELEEAELEEAALEEAALEEAVQDCYRGPLSARGHAHWME